MNRLLRHIVPFVLLVSYLPMVVMSSLHVHHDTIDVQDECLHCTGHFEKAHHHDHDCLFCEFLGASYYVSSEGEPAANLHVTECITVPKAAQVLLFPQREVRLRAPPVA